MCLEELSREIFYIHRTCNVHMDMIERIWSSWSTSGNSENLVNCLSDLMLNISILSTLTPCTFSLAFGIEWWFFKLMEAYSRGNYYFMEMFVCHSLVSYQEAGGGVFLLLGNLIIFPPSHLLYIPGAKSAEKIIKSYTQTSTSSSCLRNSRWQHTFHIPKVGCSERDRQTPAPPNLLPSFSQLQIHKPSPGWLAVSLSSGWARGFRKETLLAKALLTRILAYTLWKHLT